MERLLMREKISRARKKGIHIYSFSDENEKIVFFERFVQISSK